MRFLIDHDLHIHTKLSSCSSHPGQTPENILKYAINNGLKTICVTDHHWDSAVDGASDWYKKQGDIFSVLPLPQNECCKFLHGCETEMDKNFRIGISKEEADKLDFIIVPTTHLHFRGITFDESDDNIEGKTNLYIKRFEAFLDADLPFEKVGLAHLTTRLIHKENDGFLEVISNVPNSTFERLFKGCAERGCGVELNIALNILNDSDKLKIVMRPYEIAKAQGCKFYLGSDAHKPETFKEAPERFNKIVDYLCLTEDDKFYIGI